MTGVSIRILDEMRRQPPLVRTSGSIKLENHLSDDTAVKCRLADYSWCQLSARAVSACVVCTGTSFLVSSGRRVGSGDETGLSFIH